MSWALGLHGTSELLVRERAKMRATGAVEWINFAEVILDPTEANRVTAQHSATIMTRYGLSLDIGSCLTYEAWVGAKPLPYQLCEVALRGGSPNFHPQAN